MFDKDKQREAGRSIFMSSVVGLANVLALVAAFFATGPIYTRTVGSVVDFTTAHYGPDFTDITVLAWGVVVALATFFIARASLATLLVVGGLALATRIL